jgi:hypothetical protein
MEVTIFVMERRTMEPSTTTLFKAIATYTSQAYFCHWKPF